MNETLKSLANELEQMIAALNAISGDEPFSVASANWSFPGITKSELIESAEEILTSIRTRGREEIGSGEPRLNDYIRRLTFLRANTVPNIPGNAQAGVSAYLRTLDGLSKALAPYLRSDSETVIDINQSSKRINSQLRAMELRLNESTPRSERIVVMLDRIEHAYQAADQLPADLQSLKEDRERVSSLLSAAVDDYERIFKNKDLAIDVLSDLQAKAEEAQLILDKVGSAYAADTSQGLAGAFAERSKALSVSMWVWTAAFIAALCLGASFGSQRIHEIGDLLKNPALTNWALGINLLLAALSVGAPIWFGWMATKQINQRFRLSEDYAFKAAVSRAYEGYRKEAARIDKDLEAKLLASALNRLDEQPLRFVETANYGSPWHELASSESVKMAMKNIPGFADRVAELARSMSPGWLGPKTAASTQIRAPGSEPES